VQSRERPFTDSRVITHPMIPMKRILQISLLMVVAVGIFYAVLKNRNNNSISAQNTSEATTDEAIQGEASTKEPDIIVTYFTTDVRCKSCRAIEAMTREIVEQQFANELENGDLHFQVKNIDRSENKHFIDDYQLSFKTVVISSMKDGKEIHFSKMDKVWELLDNPDEFSDYMKYGISESFTKNS